MLKKPFAVLLCVLLFPALGSHAVCSGGDSFSFSGYLRNFFLLNHSGGDTSAGAFTRLRLELDYEQSDTFSWEFAYDIVPQLSKPDAGSSGVLIPVSSSLSYRAYDLEERIYPDNGRQSDFVLAQNLDRAFLGISARSFDLRIGRQPVAFGSARVINPTDIIAPFTYNTLVKEERAGVDALRLRIPSGRLGEIDIGLVSGEKFRVKQSAAFVRLKSYILKTDAVLMAMVFRENLLIGLNLARSIGGAGTWLEAACTFSDKDESEDYLRLSAGADYSFTPDFYAYIEYHYSQAGSDTTGNYANLLTESAYTDGAVYLLGRHYLAPGFSYQITPLLSFTGQTLINLNDASLLISPVFEYSLADDIYMEIGGYVSIGKNSPDTLNPASEFSLYPDIYFLSVNFYF